MVPVGANDTPVPLFPSSLWTSVGLWVPCPLCHWAWPLSEAEHGEFDCGYLVLKLLGWVWAVEGVACPAWLCPQPYRPAQLIHSHLHWEQGLKIYISL